MVILDTNIIIDHLRQNSDNSLFLRTVKEKKDESFALSVVSIQELYEGKSSRDLTTEKNLLAILAPLQILPYNYETAKLAGEVARDTGRPMDLADAAIAATALLNHAQLLTLNKKDFKGIDDLQLV